MPHSKHIETLTTLTFPLPHLELVLVEGQQPGEFFMMGDDNSRFDREKPAHPVHIPYDFYIGRFLVTQALYEAVVENPAVSTRQNHPIEVSWYDAQKFMERLPSLKSVKNMLDARHLGGAIFRLPTEAEWEYAARGGIYSQGYQYCGSDDLKQVGWYNANSGYETKPVGLLMPNELGIYDMSGNVYEWCADDWHDSYDAPGRPDDGSAWIDQPQRGARRVIRGGFYFHYPVSCRPANRYRYHPGDAFARIGFRVVLSLQS